MSSETNGNEGLMIVEDKTVVENADTLQQKKRKRYHRHNVHQIQQMEAIFRDCPHPDKKQRNELSRNLGMEPLQIKFWFQNKRTQMKAKHEHQENAHLRLENDKLRAENMKYKEALSNACCPACGHMAAIGDVPPDERHLRMENARLREEIGRISSIAAKYVGKPFTNSVANPSPSVLLPSTQLGMTTMFQGTTSKGKESCGAEDFGKSKNKAP